MNDSPIFKLDCNRLIGTFHEESIMKRLVIGARIAEIHTYLTSFILQVGGCVCAV